MKITEQVTFLKGTDIFSRVPSDLLMQIGNPMEEINAKAGTTVFHEGEAGDAIYLVVDGTMSIVREGIQLITLSRGDCVGEFALIDDGPRSASAVAKTDARLLKWWRKDFQKSLSKHKEVALGILKILTGKIRREVDFRIETALEQERWQQDIKRAHEIQMRMLPEGDLSTDHIEISGHCHPAANVGGDYYDYLLLEDGKLGMIIADVTGHGFYSGLFVAMAKSCLHTQVTIDYTPEKVMEAMNRTVSMSIISGMLMTCCYVLIDSTHNLLTYSNAGHSYPYHYSQSSNRLEQLVSTDTLLGVPGLEKSTFKKQQKRWEKGDLLVLYSDGIIEAKDASGEMFEYNRFEEIILENTDKSPAYIKGAILQALSRHCKGMAQSDDITLVVVKTM